MKKVDQNAAETKRAELEAMLAAGPMHDIFRADESRALVETIGTHSAAVNASTFTASFVALQTYAIDEFVLAITRLFDKAKKNYPLRSLPAIVDHVIANADALPVREPSFLDTAFTHLGAPLAGLGADSPSTLVAMGALRSMMPTPETNTALDALKAQRDKRLAHPENIAVESIPTTAWGPADELLRTAQLMLGALGGLTSVVYVGNQGDYFLTSDAQRASVSTHRLLRKLGIAPPLPHEIT